LLPACDGVLEHALLDRALGRAEQFGTWLEGGSAPSGPKPFPDYPPDGAGEEANAIEAKQAVLFE
jgi:hypothetical protein